MHLVRCIDCASRYCCCYAPLTEASLYNESVEASLALLQQESTLLLFAADNGPSLVWENLGGNNGALRCGKGTTFEGGQRSAGFAVWPGRARDEST
jgi:arylsulfatase A-like enzyme